MEMESSPVRLLGTPKRVILGTVNGGNNGSPISPMANLKLLTKVATSHISMNENSDILLSPKKTPVKYARQLRSLSFICKKFLEFYDLHIPSGNYKQLSLGQLTVLLDVEKRRVYDIINIVASLRFASKVCKDKYFWYGDQFLIPTLCQLKAYAMKKKFHHHLLKNLNNNIQSSDSLDDEIFLEDESENLEESSEKQLFDDNRIGSLCQKCMMLFLVAPKGEALNFKIISNIILPKNVPDKTGMRRLYDISNVLESLGLISRCDSRYLKKPSFVYSGPVLPSDYANPGLFPGNLLPDIDQCSDSSSECPEVKFQDILEVVCTEINELERDSSGKPPAMTAKKKLFPEFGERVQATEGFIKAPQSSFRFTPNGLFKRDKKAVRSVKRQESEVSAGAGAVDDPPTQAALPSVKINDIARPLPTIKFSAPPIQNGSIYKAVKQGNVIHLVKL